MKPISLDTVGRSVPSCVVMLMFLASVAIAQEPGPLGFAYSYNVFALDDTSSLVELDYQYSDRGLTYERVEGRDVGRILVSFTVWDSTGRPVVANSWITTSDKPGPDEEDHALLGIKLFGIRPGKHTAQIYFEDVANPSRRDSARFDLPVRGFSRSRIAVSDVEVISEIAPSEETSNRFYKNGYIIYPNVLATIEPPFLLLNTYLEIYNANSSPGAQFEVIYALADSSGTLLYQKEEKRDRPTASAVVDVHSLIVDELPSGSYFLLVKAFAGLRGVATDSAMVVRPFTLFNRDKDSMLAQMAGSASHGGSAIGVIDPIYAGMTESELDAEFAMLKYITIPREREIWDGLDGTDPKARFLTAFWTARDADPGTPDNEFRADYMKRIESANALYREPLVSQGYMSDRGRVLLQYGKPDNVERHYYDKNKKPHEVWHFSKDNVEFVFVDRTGNGRFLLVHSDAPGEIRQENWERLYATVHDFMDN